MRSSRYHPWPGHFLDPLPVSAERGFRLTAARDARSGREVVVVTPAPSADPAAARAALARFHAAHSEVVHRAIAPATELGLDPDHVVLDCPARLDLAGVLMVAPSQPRIRHGAADGFITSLRDALFAADDRGHRIGALGYANVLFARDGSFWLAGLGHNVPLADEHGHVGGSAPVFQAPEVSVGVPPTRSSDFVALLLFMRSLVPYMVLERAMARVIGGNTLAEDVELLKRLLWFEQRMFSSLPQTRAPLDEAIATSDRIRELLGVQPDVDAFVTAMGELLECNPRLSAATASAALRVAADGTFFERRGGAPTSVPGRGPLRKLLCALARARLDNPGAGLTVAELFAEGWPGERAATRSARNRVHVAIATLRKLGLGADLESHAGSYRISPSIVIELVGADDGHASARPPADRDAPQNSG